MEELLRVEELSKQFPQVLANDNISFKVKKGEIHCLLGENGAGKTTLAECLYGFYKPDTGRIYFNGEPVKLSSPSDAIQLGIGMVHQHFVLVPPLTVIENVIVGAEASGMLLDLRQAEKKLLALYENYGVEIDLKTKVWQLSVGEQQWVEILKALYVGSKLLILDEPTAVLTPQEAEKLFTTLKQMTKEGLSIIFITHKLNEVMQVSDRVTVLRKGKQIATVNTAKMTKVQLAKMMIGREVIFRVDKKEIPLGEAVLELRNLRTLGDRGQEALQGVSLTLHKHETLGLAGVAGNGQKELFEALVGVRQVTGGKVLLAGEDITNRSPQYIMSRGVVHIPEDRMADGLIPEFSIAENLILGRQRDPVYRRGIFLNRDHIKRHAQDCISDFEIVTISSNQTTKFLSGGNLQKLILARELWEIPKCILAHQPTRGLDVGAIEYIHRRLLEKREEGVGILMASEDLDELFNLSDRIAVLYKGQIMGVFDAKKADIEEVGLLMAGVEEEAA